MVFAITFEEAQYYVPPKQEWVLAPVLVATTTEVAVATSSVNPVFGGYRSPTAVGWVCEPRRDIGRRCPSRSWKLHRRTQYGGDRL